MRHRLSTARPANLSIVCPPVPRPPRPLDAGRAQSWSDQRPDCRSWSNREILLQLAPTVDLRSHHAPGTVTALARIDLGAARRGMNRATNGLRVPDVNTPGGRRSGGTIPARSPASACPPPSAGVAGRHRDQAWCIRMGTLRHPGRQRFDHRHRPDLPALSGSVCRAGRLWPGSTDRRQHHHPPTPAGRGGDAPPREFPAVICAGSVKYHTICVGLFYPAGISPSTSR